jgi:hypothetical protein
VVFMALGRTGRTHGSAAVGQIRHCYLADRRVANPPTMPGTIPTMRALLSRLLAMSRRGSRCFRASALFRREPEPEPESLSLLGGDVIMSWPPSISVMHPEDRQDEAGHD